MGMTHYIKDAHTLSPLQTTLTESNGTIGSHVIDTETETDAAYADHFETTAELGIMRQERSYHTSKILSYVEKSSISGRTTYDNRTKPL